MQYSKLAKLYENVSATSKRLEKTDILAKFLKEVPESDSEILYLLIGRVFPDSEDKVIGISNQLAIKALAKVPRPPGCKKLSGREAWRIRVGNYRIIYEIDDKESTVLIVIIRHRREIYRF